MFEGLKKYRELAVWLVLGAAALSMLLSLIEVPMRAGQSGFGSFPMAAYYGSSLLGVLPPVVLTLLVVLCLLWTRTPNARLLTLLSMIIIGASVVLELIFELIGLAADVEPWDKVAGFFQTLAGWVIPALCAFALWQLFQALPAPAPAQGQAGQFGPQGQQQLGAGGQYGQNQYGQPTQFGQQPTWQLDQASGASWNTAGQAASGASAADWGQPGTAGGWDVGQQSAGHQQSAGYQQSASHQQSASGWGSASHQQSAPHPGEGYPQQVQQPVDQGWGDQPQQQPYGDQQYDQGQQQPYGDQQYAQGQQQPYGDQQYDQGQQQYDQGQQQYGHPQQGQQPYGDQQYDQGQQQYGYPEPGQHPYGDQQNDQGPEPDEGEGQWRPAPPSQ